MSEQKKETKKFPIVPVIIATVFLVVGFTAGLFYQKSKTPSFGGNRQGQMSRGSNTNDNNGTGQKNNGQFGVFKPTSGEILNVDDKSITVKMDDGSSKIVLISDSTSINQSTSASKTDLKIGVKVSVIGDQNTDGSVTGKTINLNPQTPETIPVAK